MGILREADEEGAEQSERIHEYFRLHREFVAPAAAEAREKMRQAQSAFSAATQAAAAATAAAATASEAENVAEG